MWSICDSLLPLPPADVTTGSFPSPSQAARWRQPPWNKSTVLTGRCFPPSSLNPISSPCLPLTALWEHSSQQQHTSCLWCGGVVCHRSSVIWLHLPEEMCPVVMNGRITVFTCSVCCSRCLELYLALSLCVITKLAEPAAALDTWNYLKQICYRCTLLQCC